VPVLQPSSSPGAAGEAAGDADAARTSMLLAARAALAAAFNLGGATDVKPLPRAKSTAATGRTSQLPVYDNGYIQLGEGLALRIPLWYDDMAKLGLVPRQVGRRPPPSRRMPPTRGLPAAGAAAGSVARRGRARPPQHSARGAPGGPSGRGARRAQLPAACMGCNPPPL